MRRAINDRPYGLRLRLFAKLLFNIQIYNYYKYDCLQKIADNHICFYSEMVCNGFAYKAKPLQKVFLGCGHCVLFSAEIAVFYFGGKTMLMCSNICYNIRIICCLAYLGNIQSIESIVGTAS